MTWALFLDDIRFPEDTRNVGWRDDWMIARSYDDAVILITEHGVPDFISFDHDLADEHYESFEAGAAGEKTGYTFAKWFCNHVMENDLALPDEFAYYVHSMNPVGAQNIRNYMDSFLRHYGKHK
jgi:hypothetical protein